MKKQQKTYILLIIVFIIWGIIGFQIYNRLNPATPKLETLKIQHTFQRQQVSEQSFYALTEAYRDPFLGMFPQKKKGKRKPIIKQKSTVFFPNIVYNGVIEGNKSKSYIITVNGKQEVLKKGESHLGVKLLKATTEAVVLKFQKETKTIVKQ